MGLDISAYSHLRFKTADVPEDFDGEDESLVHMFDAGELDRRDGLPAGLYAKTERVHLWWHAEHGTHDIPESEIANIAGRIDALLTGSKAECPGDLAVLEDAPPITDDHSFRAGSYSGYNWWREQLCILALGVEPGAVWHSPDYYEGKPFYELINFSDAEGNIGPVTSTKLARDFASHETQLVERAGQAFENADEREYFVMAYRDWRRAFELAATHGFVILH